MCILLRTTALPLLCQGAPRPPPAPLPCPRSRPQPEWAQLRWEVFQTGVAATGCLLQLGAVWLESMVMRLKRFPYTSKDRLGVGNGIIPMLQRRFHRTMAFTRHPRSLLSTNLSFPARRVLHEIANYRYITHQKALLVNDEVNQTSSLSQLLASLDPSKVSWADWTRSDLLASPSLGSNFLYEIQIVWHILGCPRLNSFHMGVSKNLFCYLHDIFPRIWGFSIDPRQ